MAKLKQTPDRIDLDGIYGCLGCTMPVRYETRDRIARRWVHCGTGMTLCMSAGGRAAPNPYARKESA